MVSVLSILVESDIR